ncbi:MAG: hypothetical protein ABI823_05225 [Bryobacteraceae bacterium]
MIYKKTRVRTSVPGGYFHLEEEGTKTRVYGFGHGDSIRLTDEYGNVWRGAAEHGPDNLVFYRFRDSRGRNITGVSNSMAITLRDGQGTSWKGFIE